MATASLAKNPILVDQSTDFLEYALTQNFGDIHFKVDPATGMKAIIAVHNTKLGPALGGCRFIEYKDAAAAIADAMRLAQGMSYKNASVDLPLGGGKSVIIKPQGEYDRQGYFEAFGRFVHELNGRYITALDSGTELNDMDIVAQHTPYVASLSRYNGDPSPSTAKGMFIGIEAAVKHKLKTDRLEGVHVAIQGLGHVGWLLAQHLYNAGARLTVADINPLKVEQAIAQFNAIAMPTSIIHTAACDIFSPCALGATLNDQTIDQLQCGIIAGAANNQLAENYHGELLHNMGILYAPDYIINAGGVIFAASKYFDYPEELTEQKIGTIAKSLQEVFIRSEQENKATNSIADTLAQEKLA